MQKEIFVNVDPRETRAAVVESGQLVELHLEREERVVGSIYKAKVSNVLPGMDAAFVDIGLEKNAFLYVGDILTEDPHASRKEDPSRSRRHTDPTARIRDLVKPGQELLVQVVKAPRGTKGARVSTRISLAGRYLVFMPDAGNIGISRKIEEVRERDRLKKIGDHIRTEGGIIIRTEAEGRSEADLREDYQYLLRLWRGIQDRAKAAPAASLIHQELGLLFRVIRDMLSADVYAVVVDSRPEYEKALELARDITPRLAEKVQYYGERVPMFEAYGIEKEAERLLKPKIWMKSGGYLLIDETEALTSMDVNTGKFVGSTSLNETILKTNLEAVNEIVRQLRFRDLGGMVVLDFIDMASAADRQSLMRALDTALKNDRTRTKVAHISPLGLVEMTRKRTGENLTEALRDRCPYCEGRGNIQSPITTAVSLDRQLRDRAAREDHPAFLVTVHPSVAVEFIGPYGAAVDKLERESGKAVYIRPDTSIHQEGFAIGPADVPTMDKAMKGLKVGKALTLTVEAHGAGDDLRPIAWHNGILVDVPNGEAHIGQALPAKLTHVSRSYMTAELTGVPSVSIKRPDVWLPDEERYTKAEIKADRELQATGHLDAEFSADSRGRDRRSRRDRSSDEGRADGAKAPEPGVEATPSDSATIEASAPNKAVHDDERAGHDAGKRRRRRRPRRDDRETAPEVSVDVVAGDDGDGAALSVLVLPPHPVLQIPILASEGGEEEEHAIVVAHGAHRSKRRWQWRRRKPRGGNEKASS